MWPRSRSTTATHHHEAALSDPDGYVVVLHSPFEVPAERAEGDKPADLTPGLSAEGRFVR